LSGAVGTALKASSTPTKAADPRVQRLYAQGRAAWDRRTPDDLRRAVDDFTQAIVLDPGYAPAYVGLSDSYNLMPQYGAMSPTRAFPLAKAAAERAVLLSPKSADAHRALAFVVFWWGHDYSAGMREFKTAIRLDPNSAQTYHWYANALSEAGDTSEASAAIDRALALDPASVAIRASEGIILKNQGHYVEARQVLQAVETAHPDYISAYDYMAGLLEVEGDDVGFLQQKEKAERLKKNPDAVEVLQAARRALQRGGHIAMLRELARGDAALARTGERSGYELALAEMQLGSRREAIRALEQPATALDPNAVNFARDSAFLPLHGDPAFERLLLRLRPSSQN
jgi:tetratricopeptide (TPR) repeat protein